jgi:hypothetical protein
MNSIGNIQKILAENGRAHLGHIRESIVLGLVDELSLRIMMVHAGDRCQPGTGRGVPRVPQRHWEGRCNVDGVRVLVSRVRMPDVIEHRMMVRKHMRDVQPIADPVMKKTLAIRVGIALRFQVSCRRFFRVREETPHTIWRGHATADVFDIPTRECGPTKVALWFPD